MRDTNQNFTNASLMSKSEGEPLAMFNSSTLSRVCILEFECPKINACESLYHWIEIIIYLNIVKTE